MTPAALLQRLRLRATLFGRVDFTGDWAAGTPAVDGVVCYMPVDGRFFLHRHGVEALEVNALDVLLLPHGAGHVVSSGPVYRDPVPIETLLRRRPPVLYGALQVEGQGGDATLNLFSTLSYWEQPAVPLAQKFLPEVLLVRHAWSRSTLGPLLTAIRDEALRADVSSPALMNALVSALVLAATRDAFDLDPEARARLDASAGLSRVLSNAATLRADIPSIEDLARQAGLTRSTFLRRFARETGQTPAQYVARRRMSLAADLLSEPAMSVKATAAAVGYRSTTSFSKAFRQAHGQAPAAWAAQRRRAMAAGE